MGEILVSHLCNIMLRPADLQGHCFCGRGAFYLSSVNQCWVPHRAPAANAGWVSFKLCFPLFSTEFLCHDFCSIPTHFLGAPSVARVRSSCPAVVGCAGLAAGTLGGAVATGRESVPSESVLLIQALARALGKNPKNRSRRLVPRL